MLSDAGRLGINPPPPKTNTFCLNYTKQLMDKKTHLNNHFEHPVGQREFGRSPGTHCFRVPLPQPRTRHRLLREVVWQTAVAIKIFIKMHLKLLEDTVENIPFYAWGPGSPKPQDRILLCSISNISHTFPHILATT